MTEGCQSKMPRLCLPPAHKSRSVAPRTEAQGATPRTTLLSLVSLVSLKTVAFR